MNPCSGTSCGKGAECRVRTFLIACVCPELTEGDPFFECKPITTTTDETDNIASETSTISFTSTIDDLPEISNLKMSPNFNLTPIENHTNISKFDEGLKKNEDSTYFFPSAPPTLSHYAHSQPFYQSQLTSGSQSQVPLVKPPSFNPEFPSSSHLHQQSNHVYSNSRNRQRPQQSFHGTINHAFNTDPTDSGTNHNQPINPHHHKPTNINRGENNGSPFDSQQNRIHQHQFQRIISEQPQRQNGGLSNNQQQYPPQHHGFPPVNHIIHNNPTHTSSSSQQYNYQSTHFNLKQENLIPLRQDLVAKDMIGGVYADCRTVNNRIVCADITSSNQEFDTLRHRVPLVPITQGFEHRHISVGNENTNNNFQNQPQIDDIFQIGSKLKAGHHQNSHGDDRHHVQGHPSGPIGTLNLHSSSEVQESHRINGQEKPFQQQSIILSDSKPFIPQVGSEEAKLCQQMCGDGAVCRVFHARPICGCPEGHTGNPAQKCFPESNTKYDPNSCQRHVDCASAMICLNSQCTDPCLIKSTFDTSNISSFHYSLDTVINKNENMCGPNAKCSVIEHTALCSCEKNHFGNPYVGCVS